MDLFFNVPFRITTYRHDLVNLSVLVRLRLQLCAFVSNIYMQPALFFASRLGKNLYLFT